MLEKIPQTMQAVLLTGNGGFEKLVYRSDVLVPVPGPKEVLIQVGAAGINNTDINTRIGWYSKSVSSATDQGGMEGYSTLNRDDASWQGVSLAFPRIQGADCCGRIVAVGEGDAVGLGIGRQQSSPTGLLITFPLPLTGPSGT